MPQLNDPTVPAALLCASVALAAAAAAAAGEAAKKVSRLALERIRMMQLEGEERTREFKERIAGAEKKQAELQV